MFRLDLDVYKFFTSGKSVQDLNRIKIILNNAIYH